MQLNEEPPVIEHDKGEFRRPILLAIWTARIQIFVLVGVGVLMLGFSRGQVMTVPDAIFILLFLVLLVWCIVPSVSSIYPGSHEGAGDGFAFSMGKALKRILYNRRRDTAPRN